jgi:rhodanese-related sulfurtransferase
VQAAATAKRVAAEDGVKTLSVDDVRRLWDGRRERNVYLVDVRTADEYEAGHVAGSIWAPGGQAVQATDDYFAVRGAAFVFICDGFVRSVMTAAWFTRMGVPNVAVLAGGVPAWQDAGGLIDNGLPAPTPFGWDAARAATRYRKPGDLGSAVVVDVGMSDEYTRGHVPGAGWICRSRLEAKIASAAPDRARPIVVACADGVASTLAAITLTGLGYKNVSVLDGGTQGWTDASQPLEQGATHLWDEPDDVVLKPYQRGREAMEAYLRWEEALDPDGSSPHRLLKDR